METDLEEKLGAILADPAMMEKIQSFARTLGQSAPDGPHQEPAKPALPQKLPDFDPSLLRGLSALAGQNRSDPNEQALLQALKPYLSKDRITKLENAMRAARMARMASGLLGSGALQSLLGRNGHV